MRRLPSKEVPEFTEGYEGFFHLHQLKGNVEQSVLHYIIRDHDSGLFNNRKQFIIDLLQSALATIESEKYIEDGKKLN